jgi:hypothetical protein
MTEFFRYVRFNDTQAFEEHGWRFACRLSLPHGEWSCLMRWEGHWNV